MERSEDADDSRTVLARMVDAITAADTQTAWPARELSELAEEVLGEGAAKRVWALS
jgi:hypothetical protein